VKIKVGDKFYDSQDGPIMIILSQKEKDQVAGMLPRCTKYAQYPDTWTKEQAVKWMGEMP